MGCDIHLYVEKFNGETNTWEPVKGPNSQIANYREWAENSRKSGDLETAARFEEEAKKIENFQALTEALVKLEETYPKNERKENPDLEEEYQAELRSVHNYDGPTSPINFLYNGRNYDVFSILADVRNGYGFAGVKTGAGFNPISEPKGLPDNVSTLVYEASDAWGIDGHSHSYLTLRELLEYDWNQVTQHTGYVSKEYYKTFKEKGKPDSWSAGVWGADVKFITNQEMDEILNGSSPDTPQTYTHVVWDEPYYVSADNFYTKSIPMLKELSDGKPDDIRIVFWFDN